MASTKQHHVAQVMLWGIRIGAVAWDPDREIGLFEYDPEFLSVPVEVAPLMMPRRAGVFSFAGLPRDTFKGLPGLLADSLPDRFGNQVINAWLARQSRTPDSFSPVERLCYIGSRGMGALEFTPAIPGRSDADQPVEIAELVSLASRVLSTRKDFSADASTDHSNAMTSLLQVGSSAGGARAKAVLAWNPATNEFRSGQVDGLAGFDHWLVKFDGVSNNGDHGLADPQGFGRIEYAYHLMARAAGIHMTDCRLFEEGGRAHFMTRRFDRPGGDDKLHLQSLCAIAHLDYNQAGAHGYEQAMMAIRQLRIENEAEALEQMFRRMLFNLVTRNQDDHTKNIAFLMDRDGQWRLAPAFDVTYSFNPDGQWTSTHQMTVNGKRDHFTAEDIETVASFANITPRRLLRIMDAINMAVSNWRQFAGEAGVPVSDTIKMQNAFRLTLIQRKA